jgi:hypothetical protein
MLVNSCSSRIAEGFGRIWASLCELCVAVKGVYIFRRNERTEDRSAPEIQIVRVQMKSTE